MYIYFNKEKQIKFISLEPIITDLEYIKKELNDDELNILKNAVNYNCKVLNSTLVISETETYKKEKEKEQIKIDMVSSKNYQDIITKLLKLI